MSFVEIIHDGQYGRVHLLWIIDFRLCGRLLCCICIMVIIEGLGACHESAWVEGETSSVSRHCCHLDPYVGYVDMYWKSWVRLVCATA